MFDDDKRIICINTLSLKVTKQGREENPFNEGRQTDRPADRQTGRPTDRLTDSKPSLRQLCLHLQTDRHEGNFAFKGRQTEMKAK